ncbi:MAG: DUF4255 domain-containing protein [Streptosporangiales bacterium]|nr:DUF4255 domain-containing protein [Streptosporangiales bacterium]
MIHEVDAAIRVLIEERALSRAGVEVVFEAPTKEWAAKRGAPAVNVYLYDIREDIRRRQGGLVDEYDGNGRVTRRAKPPRYFKLSYLITAWTQRPEDEHRLLSQVLLGFLGHEALPSDLLSGSIADLGLTIPLTVALPPPEDRSFADVWSALGGELKPSIDVVVSAPVDTTQRYEAGPPVAELRAGVGSADGALEPVPRPWRHAKRPSATGGADTDGERR